MKKRIPVLILAIAMMMVAATSCKENDTTQPPLASGTVIVTDDAIPETTPNISGVVTSISTVREGVVLMVEPNDASLKTNSSASNVYVTLTSKTILEDKDKKRLPSFDEIKLGSTLSVWFRGSSTGTEPSYAVAHGIRMTNGGSDKALCVAAEDTIFLATHLKENVSLSDLQKLFYGSYMSTVSNSVISFEFSESPQSFSFEVYSNGELCAAEEYLLTDYFSTTAEVHLNENLVPGDYTVRIVGAYEDSTENYAFALHVK